jgi:hypothetical protein
VGHEMGSFMYFSLKKTVFFQDWFKTFLLVCADGMEFLQAMEIRISQGYRTVAGYIG